MVLTQHRRFATIEFGLNPIACHSGTDNGCFFGDGQSPDSSTIGAPQWSGMLIPVHMD